METNQDNPIICKVDVNEFQIEINHSGFIPEWFQSEFGKLLYEIIKSNVLELNSAEKSTDGAFNEKPAESMEFEKENIDAEYVNWDKPINANHFTVSGSIKYEQKTRISIQINISRGEAIKFSSSYGYEIDSIIENISEIIRQIKNFILVSCGTEDHTDSFINSQQFYSEVVKILEDNQEDKTIEKYFVTGLFLAKAGDEDKALESLDYVIGNASNPEIVQDCYKVVLAVKAKKNMKDLHTAQDEVYKGDPNKAVPLVESLIQITPKYIHLHFLLGMAYKKSGQREKAIEAFKKALKIDQNHIPSLRELAEELVATARLDEAESIYRRIVELNQANATDYYNFGMCLKRVGKVKELDEIIDKIKELDTEGKLDSYLFNLFEFKPEHFKTDDAGEKKSFWSRLFGKK